MGTADKFCLKWNDYEQNMNQAFIDIRETSSFLDVTLVCEDNLQMPAHKVILSACSSFFRKVLEYNPHQHPLLYLRGVRYEDLENIVDFMYHGEVNIAQEELNSFLAVAEDLKIKGLTQNLAGGSPSKRKDFSPARSPLPPPSISPRTPASKRSRRDLSINKNNLNSDIIEDSRLPVKPEPRDISLPSIPLHLQQPDTDIADVSADADDSFDNSENNYEGGFSAGTYAPGYDPANAMPGYEPANLDHSIVSSDNNKGISTGQSGMTIEQLADLHLKKSDHGYSYDCLLCGKNYRDRYTAQDHLECHHIPSFDRYECELCGKRHNARKQHLKHKTACQKKAPNHPNQDPTQFLDQGTVSEYFDERKPSPPLTRRRGPKGKLDSDCNIKINSELQGGLLDADGGNLHDNDNSIDDTLPVIENVIGSGEAEGNENSMPIMGHMQPPFQPIIVDSQTADERIDDLAKEHIQRQGFGKDKELMCKICGKMNKDWTKAKSHLESIHFPTEGAYSCAMCGKVKNTKKALRCHERKCV